MSEYIYEETPSGSDVFGRPVDAPMLTRREEIVRCRDCRWIHMFLDYKRTYPEITMYTAYECACLNRRIYDMDMFCAWGVKRKEGGE